MGPMETRRRALIASQRRWGDPSPLSKPGPTDVEDDRGTDTTTVVDFSEANKDGERQVLSSEPLSSQIISDCRVTNPTPRTTSMPITLRSHKRQRRVLDFVDVPSPPYRLNRRPIPGSNVAGSTTPSLHIDTPTSQSNPPRQEFLADVTPGSVVIPTPPPPPSSEHTSPLPALPLEPEPEPGSPSGSSVLTPLPSEPSDPEVDEPLRVEHGNLPPSPLADDAGILLQRRSEKSSSNAHKNMRFNKRRRRDEHPLSEVINHQMTSNYQANADADADADAAVSNPLVDSDASTLNDDTNHDLLTLNNDINDTFARPATDSTGPAPLDPSKYVTMEVFQGAMDSVIENLKELKDLIPRPAERPVMPVPGTTHMDTMTVASLASHMFDTFVSRFSFAGLTPQAIQHQPTLLEHVPAIYRIRDYASTTENQYRGSSSGFPPQNDLQPQNIFQRQNNYRPASDFQTQGDFRPPDHLRSQDHLRPQDDFRPHDEFLTQNEIRSQTDVWPQNGPRPHNARPHKYFRPQTNFQPPFRPRGGFRPHREFLSHNEFQPHEAGPSAKPYGRPTPGQWESNKPQGMPQFHHRQMGPHQRNRFVHKQTSGAAPTNEPRIWRPRSPSPSHDVPSHGHSQSPRTSITTGSSTGPRTGPPDGQQRSQKSQEDQDHNTFHATRHREEDERPASRSPERDGASGPRYEVGNDHNGYQVRSRNASLDKDSDDTHSMDSHWEDNYDQDEHVASHERSAEMSHPSNASPQRNRRKDSLSPASANGEEIHELSKNPWT